MTTRTRGSAAGRAALAGALALGGVLALGGAKPAAAGMAAITSCPALITTPGTYVLANDLHCSGPGNGAAIWVQASNVRLVLGNHTISFSGDPGQGLQLETGVLAESLGGLPLTGVSIEGGTMTGFFENVRTSFASGLRISGVTTLNSSSVNMHLSDCTDCRVVDSRVSGAEGIGILVDGNSAGARISGDTVTGNGFVGIEVASTGVRLTDNVATGNLRIDLQDDNPGPPCANTWRDNPFDNVAGNGKACIQ